MRDDLMIRFDGRNEVDVEKDKLQYEISNINTCIMFSQGVLFQGKRLLSAINSKDIKTVELSRLEEELFLHALERAISKPFNEPCKFDTQLSFKMLPSSVINFFQLHFPKVQTRQF